MNSVMRDKIIYSLLESDKFDGEMEKLIAVQSVNLFFDTFEFDDFYENKNFTYEEYKFYFQPILQAFRPIVHKMIKKTLKQENKK